jgi:peptidyl-prolyl cis-trans isomerase B (cyclophilin B)
MKILHIIFFSLIISSCTDKSGTPQAIITVPQGQVRIGFYSEEAPKHVANFIKLVESGFYNGTTFHRVERGYLIQGGDPNSKNNTIYDDGTGQLEYTLPSEYHHKHIRGAIAMAKKPLSSNPENRSNACQFYIALDQLPQLDEERYTIFAFVIDGFETLKKMTELEIQYDMNPNSNWEKVTEMEIEMEYVKETRN